MSQLDFGPTGALPCDQGDGMDGLGTLLPLKVRLVGDVEAGKSALLDRAMHDTFRRAYKATSAAGVRKEMSLPMPPPPEEPTARVTLRLVDTGGSTAESFDTCTARAALAMHKGTTAALVVHIRPPPPTTVHTSPLDALPHGCPRFLPSCASTTPKHTHTHTHRLTLDAFLVSTRDAQVFDLVKAGPDADSADGFSNVRKWLAALREHAPDCLLFLVGTHLDVYRGLPRAKGGLPDDPDACEARLRSRVRETLVQWGREDVPFYAVSSKDGTNVQALMTDVARTWLARTSVPTRRVCVQAPGWDAPGTTERVLDVPVAEAEREGGSGSGPDVVTAGSVAAAFVKKHARLRAFQRDVIVLRVSPGKDSVPPVPLSHAAVTALPSSDDDVRPMFCLKRRQPLTPGLHCEVCLAIPSPTHPRNKRYRLSPVRLEEADEPDTLRGFTVGDDDDVPEGFTLNRDDPQWVPINTGRRLALNFQTPKTRGSNWTWERFLAENDARAAPLACFAVIDTVDDLRSQ